MKARSVEIVDGGAAIAIGGADGDLARFHAVWLRDNALDPGTRSPRNGQRLISVMDVPPDVRVVRAGLTGEGDVAVTFGPVPHDAVFPAAWLDAHRYDRDRAAPPGWLPPEIVLWRGDGETRLPSASFPAISTDLAALRAWLGGIAHYGVALLTDVPCSSGSLVEVAKLFGYIRQTNYGRWFDVRAEVDPSNLAYTNLGLQAHTDNPYRDPVPTLQLLACLENTVEGGESLVVDGFAVAKVFQAEDPRGFELLGRYPARFEYAGSTGVRLAAKRPMIELGPDGELIAIRFNNRSAAPFVDVPYAAMTDFYAAYRRFAEFLEDPAMAVTFRMASGDLFIVDNTRVLHARKAFSGSGSRWLQGCYADKDGLLSTLAVLSEADEG